MLKFTLQNRRKSGATSSSTSGSEGPGSPTAGSFTSSASSGSGSRSGSGSVSGSGSNLGVRNLRRTLSGSTSSLSVSHEGASDDGEGKWTSETASTWRDSDTASFTVMDITNGTLKGKKNVSFQPEDTVYMIESPQDSSSGIASDDHTSTPNGASTHSSSDPTYGLVPTDPSAATRLSRSRPPPAPSRPPPGPDSWWRPPAAGGRPLRAVVQPQVQPPAQQPEPLHPKPAGLDPVKQQALSPRARAPVQYRHPPPYPSHTRPPPTTHEMILNQKNSFPYPTKPPHLPDHSLQDTERLITFAARKAKLYRQSYFDLLPDDVILRIFANLTSVQLCQSARVCRRWHHLVWEPCLWTTIRISGSRVDVNRALKVLTRRLSYDTPSVCVMVERIYLNGCDQLTDKGLHTIAKRCLELRHLEVQGCVNITNIAIFEVVSQCVNMEHLNVAGCPGITCICLTPEATVQAPAYGRQIYLRYLDMTDCLALEDSGLQIIASYCPQLVFLYMRRCMRVTDLGIQYVANYCNNIREFSISDCRKVTDFGMRELAKLGSNLRYLSVAKCDKISDVGVKYIAQYCHKLRYLNVRGCEAVSDDSVELLAKFCKRLKSLDIGKCDITDEGLQILGENCQQLRRLSVKSCEVITDRGVALLAYYCRQLQQLNIQECQLSVESYRAVKKYCKKCIIEHTNPGFY